MGDYGYGSNSNQTWWERVPKLHTAIQRVLEDRANGKTTFVWGVDILSDKFGEWIGKLGKKRQGAKLWRLGELSAAHAMLCRDRAGIYELLYGHRISVMYFDIDLNLTPMGHVYTEFQQQVNLNV